MNTAKEVGGTAELNSEIIDQTANAHKLANAHKEVGGTAELNSEIIDQTANAHKLLTLQALHI